MAEQVCPVCGCEIGIGAHEEEGVVYCCSACPIGEQCECGLCAVAEEEESHPRTK